MHVRSVRQRGSRAEVWNVSFVFWASRIVLTTLFFLIVCVTGTLAASSVNVPVGNWAYSALDKLDGYGLIQSDIYGTRPYTRIEFARLINEALTRKEQSDRSYPSIVDEILKRLQREFSDELLRFGRGEGTSAKSFFKPIDEAQARYVYVDGEPHDFNRHQGTQIDATEGTPLVYNNDGIIYGKHHNFQLQFSSSMRFKDVLSGYIEPVLLVRQNEGDWHTIGEEAQVDLLKGYAKVSPWNVEIEAGRDSMWWGQGYHGSLIMTNNAWPIDMVKVSNPSPTLLPWYFRYLGPFKYTFFLSQLQDFRVLTTPPDAREIFTDVGFAGYRFQIKPLPYLELGAATTFIFGGEGRPGLTWDDIVRIIGFQSSRPAKGANQIAQIDMRVQLPFLWDAEFYGEFGGEDSGSTRVEEFLFRDIGYVLGLYFPRITPDGRADFRLEYANNAFEKDEEHRGFWYGHSLYRSGYTHNEMIMGHHMGPDAEDLFARVSYYIRDDLRVGLDYDYMARGENNPLTPAVERSNEVGTDLTYEINDRLSLTSRFAFEAVKNFNLDPGADRNNHLLQTGMKYRF